jgi:hypothetical protein
MAAGEGVEAGFCVAGWHAAIMEPRSINKIILKIGDLITFEHDQYFTKVDHPDFRACPGHFVIY